MSDSVHLPNELWLLIIPHCSPADLWRSGRRVNAQLKDCVDQFFEREVLPHLIVSLPVALPTYDIRNPVRGQAVFHPLSPKTGPEPGRLHVQLAQTEPEHYRTHFLDRWQGMQQSADAALGQHIRFDVQLADRTVSMRLPDARGELVKSTHDARMSFQWTPAMTAFFL
ncbi:hypothetical protein AC578_7255 [Pseudocercospora eumusae]|uniref:F-box domain-containing protein n=1 Tax=Pseudocercospora eumusae TaxID=321146 RepID=A0A139HWJ0_9PEZI|nr:hypothetical protein AC578_7255 [Pseudocercospora eumusae]